MDILVVYQFCTFGGVERVVLNRAQSFRKHGLDVNIHIGYLRDRGALASFNAYLQANNLRGRVNPFIFPKDLAHDWGKYEYVFIVDTPDVFAASTAAKNVHVECHTPYIQSRQYLRELPAHIKSIIVPSRAFKDIIESEFDTLPEVRVFPNPVADEYLNLKAPAKETIFTRRPVTYFARVEDLKNFIEAARIFETIADQDDLMYWVVGENADEKQVIQSLERKGLLAKSFLRSHVDFNRVTDLVRMVKGHRGVFLSPSKGESFGLSAAEFISGGVPVLLSDISPHVELVGGDERFIYPLGDVTTAREKLLWLFANWDEASQIMTSTGKKFDGENFIRSWREFVERYP